MGDDSPKFRFLPLTISLDTQGGIASPMILRGSPLPATRTKTFSTADDDQEVVTIHLIMGERPLAKHCIEIAKIDLGDIPPAPRGEPEIELTVAVDRECRLSLVAKETRSGKHLEVDSQLPQIELDQNTIQNFMDEAEEHKEDDQAALREIEIRNKSERLIARGEARLANPGGLSSFYQEKLNAALAELGLAVQNDDTDKIKSASSRVEAALTGSNDLFGAMFADIFGGSATFSEKPGASSRDDKITKSHNKSDGKESPSSTTMEPSHQVFGSQEFTPDPSLCFVLMPFDKAFGPIYDDHIRDVVVGESLTCRRADEIVGVNQITADIWEYVNRSRLLIADLTNMNANVFYELGLAHALGKPVILLTQSLDHVPFDLKAHRCLIYEYTPRGMKALEQKLRRTIREIINA